MKLMVKYFFLAVLRVLDLDIHRFPWQVFYLGVVLECSCIR